MHIRKFLNRASNSLSLSSITAKIQLTTWRDDRPMRDSDYEYINAELAIANGGSVIQLAVDFSEEGYADSLKSLNVLWKSISEFRKGVLQAKKIKDAMEERREADRKVQASTYSNEEYEGWNGEDYEA